ncbi:MAG: peptidylprolyl isomerase [Actinomycetota bacterium]|nr:peptidylprolyl isomerase [Actinomycetota bacterium]
MPKQDQRRKQRERRARRAHAERVAAQTTTRRQRRAARVGVALVAVLGILFLGVLGSLVQQEAEVQAPAPSTTAGPPETAPAPEDVPAEPPPCPEADGSSPRRTVFDQAPEMCIDPAKDYRARFVTTAGVFSAELHPRRSPLAVNNFVFLARYHFYDDLPFHRVVQGLYAQSGNPVADDQSGPGYTFDDDPLPQPGEYGVGSLVMAHDRADANGSQFLIWLGPQAAELEPVFPLFGQVTEGLEVLEEISADGGTAENPRPATVHRIERIDIVER